MRNAAILGIFTILLVAACAGTKSVPLVVPAAQEITIRSAEKAPSGFTTWTFFWRMPMIDPGAKLQYMVLDPGGGIYHQQMCPAAAPDRLMRSDFAPGVAGGDVNVFYDRHVRIKFRVDKGTIDFLMPGDIKFQFSTQVKAVFQ